MTRQPTIHHQPMTQMTSKNTSVYLLGSPVSRAAFGVNKDSVAGRHMDRKNADPLVAIPSASHAQRNDSAAQTRSINIKALKFKRRDRYYGPVVQEFVLDAVTKAASQGSIVPSE